MHCYREPLVIRTLRSVGLESAPVVSAMVAGQNRTAADPRIISSHRSAQTQPKIAVAMSDLMTQMARHH